MNYTDMLLGPENPFSEADRRLNYLWLVEVSRQINGSEISDKRSLWEEFIAQEVVNGNQHELIVALTENGHSRIIRETIFRNLDIRDADSINFVNAVISSHRWKLGATVNNPPGRSSIHTVNAHTYRGLMKKTELPDSVLLNVLQSVGMITNIYVFLTEAEKALTFNNILYVYSQMPERLLMRKIWVNKKEALPEGVDEYFMTIGEMFTLLASRREPSIPFSWVEKMFKSLKTVES